ncbi:unnamed protein product [Brassica oleracea var. botrytis]|uniref:(rape) hypothetical protein n=1 Tax=Brassica napus TaxID=3708 RepID=A0A078GCA7_BRANA|nr:unnamed protein product [Brassica napus]CDY22974.1 BnaC03g40950D [Brassica napus]
MASPGLHLRLQAPGCSSCVCELSLRGFWFWFQRSLSQPAPEWISWPSVVAAERILGVQQSLHRSGVLLALRRRGRVTLCISSKVNRLYAAFSSSPFMVPGNACKKPLLMLVVLLIDQSVVLLINLVV